MRTSLRTLLAVVTAAIAALPAVLVAAPPATAATYSTPAFVRAIGAHGEAAVYAWGMAFNPVSQEILVGDYWNFQVRRYALDGTFKGSFFRAANLRKGQPYTISVDPGNGDIFVAELSDGSPRGYFGVYSKEGTYLRELRVSGSYPVWTSIDTDRTMWIADAHNTSSPRIRQVSLSSGNTLEYWGDYGTSPGDLGRELHGIDTDSSGNVYVADAHLRRVTVFDDDGDYLRTIGGPGNGFGQFTGDLRGLAIDKAAGLVYVVDAEASQVDVFTTSGSPVRSFGSQGMGAGQFADGGRQLAVDASGAVWVADYGNYRFHRFSSTGTLLGTYPDPAAGPVPGGFAQNRDVAVDSTTGEVWSADSWNNRFQKFSPDGTFLGSWGQRGSTAPYGMNYPRGIAVNPANGDVWVANTRDHVIRVYRPDGTYVRTIGSTFDSSDPGSFRWVMDLEFHNGRVYVSDYNSSYFKVLDASDGTELTRVRLDNSGVAVSPTTGVLYVSSWQNRRVYMYNAMSLAYLGSFGSSGSGNGQFSKPWDVDVLGDIVWVTDAQLGRVQAFSLTGSYLGQFGTKGSGAYQFNNPSGITHDNAGNLYIADAGNDRVMVYSTTSSPTTGDSTAPSVGITTANNAVLPAVSPAVLTGTYADNTRIAKVEVATRNRVTNLWWNAGLATWQPAKLFNKVMVAGSPTSGTWRAPLVTFNRGDTFFAQVRAVDDSGNVSAAGPQLNFSIASGGEPDTVAPSVSITAPTLNSTVGLPVTVTGQVVDDRAVGTVDVAVRNTATGLWWQPATGTWAAAIKWDPVALDAPGGTGSAWSHPVTGAQSGQQYYVQVRTTDAAGNAGPVKPFTRFTVS